MVDPRYTTRPPKADVPADDGAWFAQKRFGYGAGWPIRWQGWALMVSYLAVVGGTALLNHTARGAGVAITIGATLIFTWIAARHTRGGWRWRWGNRA